MVQFDGTGRSAQSASPNPSAMKSAGMASGRSARANRQSPFSDRTQGKAPRASAMALSG